MEQANNYSRRLWRWLDRMGFGEDPFALYEADQEGASLHELFVDRPYLHNILGDPTHPQPGILMAGRGAGKTATREMVAYECAKGRHERRALAVRYCDFGLPLEKTMGEARRLTARHHVSAIARLMLKTLAEDVPATYFDVMSPGQQALLASCAQTFADPLSKLKLAQLVKAEPLALDWEAMSAREALATMADLVTHLGPNLDSCYRAMYILIDRVDETAGGPEAVTDILKPLIADMTLLETPRTAFKFFLSADVGQRIYEMARLRPDRVRIEVITWNDEALGEVVHQRVKHYSDEGHQRFEDLCVPTIKGIVIDRLVRASEGSPRTLLRLCQALIRRRATRMDTDDSLIDRGDLLDTLAMFTQQLADEQRETTAPAVTAANRAAPPQVGLFLDDNNHVWVDGKLVAPPLSEREFRLLEALYRRAPEIVSNEALIRAVWSEEDSMDDQNLRKLVDRLRRRLAPDAPGRASRFIANVPGRGYWLKANAAEPLPAQPG